MSTLDPWEGRGIADKEPGGLAWGAQEPRVRRTGRGLPRHSRSHPHLSPSVLCGGERQ